MADSSISTSTTDGTPSLRNVALLRLLQLTSPALPVGAFNFSQGLECVVDAGDVSCERSAGDWIGGLARHAIGRLDIPILLRMHRAWSQGDSLIVQRWSERLIAARDTSELRAEDRHMGSALAKVLAELDISDARAWINQPHSSFAALFALAAQRWSIAQNDMASGYLWAWIENQVLGAVKLIPLGQSAGQRLLDRLLREIPDIVGHAATLAADDIGVATPMQSLASMRHETQYTRLFRS